MKSKNYERGRKLMEQYLIDQYDVYEDKKWLTDASDIEDYFTDEGREFMECGQGFYQDSAELICKIGDKFYEVLIEAEIGSAKQDIGDRLYWVEDIERVSYKEIDKPKKKDKTIIEYTINLTERQRSELESYLSNRGIEYK